MSSGGGGSGGRQDQTTQVILPDWLQAGAQKSIESAQKLAGREYQADPNAQVAAMTPDQQQAYATIRAMQGGTAPAFNAALGSAYGLVGSAAPITTGQINADTQSLMNPYIGAVVDPTTQQMRQAMDQSLNATRANAANVGAFGGSRLGVQEGTAQAQEALGEGQLVGGLLSAGYNTAQERAMGLAGTNLQAGEWAAGALPALATGYYGQTAKEAALLEGAGRAQQGQSQAELDQASANWQNEWNYPLIQQQILEQALTSTPYGGTTQQTMSRTGAPASRGSQAMGALGGAASGAAMGSMIAPGYGTAIGAVAGGLLGAFGSG
jgi:hypothetical protein